MHYHIVLLQLKADAADGDIGTARAALLGLQATIEGIRSIAWGANTSPEGLGQGYDIGVLMRFTDRAARDAYLPHPDHQAIVPSILAVAEQVLVFDLEAAPLPTGTP